MGIRIRKYGAGQCLWKLLVVFSLVASWEAQALVKETAPGSMMYCNTGETLHNQIPPYKPGDAGCTYSTAMAAAEARAAIYNANSAVIKMAYDSCEDIAPGLLRGLYNEYPLGARTPYAVGYRCHYYYIGFSNVDVVTGPSYVTYFPIAVSCPVPSYNPAVPYQSFDIYTATCVRYVQNGPNLIITLTGGNEVEPSTPASIKTLPIIATVKDQSTGRPPTTPITVRVSLKVDPTSGGHDHGDSTRPRGGIADVEKCLSDDTCKEWTLPANIGVVEFNFKAPEASGIHTITATCVGCTNTATKPVDVKVDGLKPIPASAFYAFIGGGVGKPHQDNHYLTPTAAAVLWEIAIAYQVNPQFKWRDRLTGQLVSPPILHVNDASLEWGGVFDAVNANWMPPHHEHRQGVVVDLRANDAPGAIPPRNFIEFDTYLDMQQIKYLHECAKDKKGTPPASRHNRLWPGCISKLDGSMDINRHYHVRLLGVSE